MEDRSCILLVPDATKDTANKVIARMFGDPPEAQNISVPLSATGSAPATHWCNHIWRSEAAAADLLALPTNSGTLPEIADGLTWEDYGTTEAEARTAAATLGVYVATGGVPTEHLDGVLSGRGLQRVQSSL
jgi:hypothetical protein